jgi:preprotein translocase subunit SecA
MGPIYRTLGLSVAFVQRDMRARARQLAYAADITYVTAKEAGFDHLRDLCADSPGTVVHRPFHVALVDEADSLLIDEARVPLVLAGSFTGPASATEHAGGETAVLLALVVSRLSAGRDFVVDESGRNAELTDAGLGAVERALGRGSLHESGDDLRLSQVNCALHARALLRRGVDYLVREGRIEMIDEMTGRVVPDRRWPEGLQTALDAKEGLTPSPEGQVMASLSLQRFLRGYPTLAGMTGTAQGAAAELHDTYGRRVVVIPPHKPSRRLDQPDTVFTHREAKDRAVVEAVVAAHRAGRPVLIGTLTVDESERLAARVSLAGVPCQVLNAAHDEEEAVIVARAGERGAVTIATNMAGRGTDIRLGGPDERDHDAVAALGGLLVIGTNRHESRRVDRQLRGRAGRQGDPGESKLFVSLEDDLLVRHGGLSRLIPAALVPAQSDRPVEGAVLRREIARAQRIIEGQHWDIRRMVGRYAAVVERQFDVVIEERRALVGSGDAAGVSLLDRLWRQHLARCADLRDGAHLARLGGRDPLSLYTTAATESFARFNQEYEAAGAGERGEAVLAPATTWTYLVNDDPFRHTMGSLLTGPGGPTVAIYAAALLAPLFLTWGVVERWWGGKKKREPPDEDSR